MRRADGILGGPLLNESSLVCFRRFCAGVRCRAVLYLPAACTSQASAQAKAKGKTVEYKGPYDEAEALLGTLRNVLAVEAGTRVNCRGCYWFAIAKWSSLLTGMLCSTCLPGGGKRHSDTYGYSDDFHS
jgi:hypothetical protein